MRLLAAAIDRIPGDHRRGCRVRRWSPTRLGRRGSSWPVPGWVGHRVPGRGPSKLQRPSGDRVKTEVCDARHLAQLLHLGQIVAVTVPSVEQQAARDLVWAREDVRGDLMSARYRLSKLLLRQGIVYYGGKPWTANPKVKPGTSEPNHRLGLGVLRSRDGRSRVKAGSRVTL